jgi:hypothetical protein
MVLLPELVEGRWWGYLMHARRERQLRVKLLRYGGPEIVVATVPWQLQPARPAEGVAEEEPAPLTITTRSHDGPAKYVRV